MLPDRTAPDRVPVILIWFQPWGAPTTPAVETGVAIKPERVPVTWPLPKFTEKLLAEPLMVPGG